MLTFKFFTQRAERVGAGAAAAGRPRSPYADTHHNLAKHYVSYAEC